MVHKGTLSGAAIVTVHSEPHGKEACHRLDCKEEKDYGVDKGSPSGSKSKDGDCATTTEDAIILGKLTEEIALKAKGVVDAITAGSTALPNCTEAGKGGEKRVSDEAKDSHGPEIVVTAITEDAAERSHNKERDGKAATDDEPKVVTDVHHEKHGVKQGGSAPRKKCTAQREIVE